MRKLFVRRRWSFKLGMMLILLLHLGVTAYADSEYIHGYFRYTVADNSITITAYTGEETVVTVPAMIGGNPVNAIAPGAFAGTGVTTVYLPDTIMSMESGALGNGQSVVYSQPTDGDDPASDAGELNGLRDDNGNLITTDDEGNLVLVDSDGNETVLDDSQTYVRETDENGSTVIQNEAGGKVTVQDGGKVSFVDADRNQITVGAAGGKTVQSTGSQFGYEEADIEALNTKGMVNTEGEETTQKGAGAGSKETVQENANTEGEETVQETASTESEETEQETANTESEEAVQETASAESEKTEQETANAENEETTQETSSPEAAESAGSMLPCILALAVIAVILAVFIFIAVRKKRHDR